MAQEMQAGALGLSSGLEYDPGFYSTTDELAACAQVAGKYGGLYISHVRDEGNQAIESFEELITIARRGRSARPDLAYQVGHVAILGQGGRCAETHGRGQQRRAGHQRGRVPVSLLAVHDYRA